MAVLDGERRDDGGPMDPIGGEDLEVGLEACAASGVGARDGESTLHGGRW